MSEQTNNIIGEQERMKRLMVPTNFHNINDENVKNGETKSIEGVYDYRISSKERRVHYKIKI